MDELQRAKALRDQAGRLEEIGRVKKRLLDLIEISQDPYYDQYLKQMLKDLEGGNASPQQVQQEMERTYKIYLERMRETKKAKKASRRRLVSQSAMQHPWRTQQPFSRRICIKGR